MDTNLALTLLNGDSSWLIEVDGTRLLLDPWLEGDAIVFARPIHVAHLGRPAIRVEDLPPVDALVISHPFADHCNKPTLRKLPRDLSVYTPVVAVPWVKMLGGFKNVTALPDCTKGRKPVAVGNLTLAWCRAAATFDTTHNALIVRGAKSGTTVMYCPHALLLEGPTIEAVERELGGRLDALLCSFNHLWLPGHLGGVANLGVDAAVGIASRFSARYVFSTHDSEKPDSGYIARQSKMTYCKDMAAALSGRAPTSQPVFPATAVRWQPA